MINTQTLWFRFPRAAFARETGQRISRIAWMCVRMTKSECLMLKESVSRQSAIKHQTANSKQRSRAAFTLIELLVVMAIIAILLLLVAPAFTNIKGGRDVTSAAYTIKGVLDTARTYAMANNTYTWVGFFEENVASTTAGTAGVGRLVMSIVASQDGTNVATTNPIDPTKLIQVGKLTKIDNVHLATFTDGSGTGSTFDTRPPVTYNGMQYSIANMANATTPFQCPVGNPAPAAQYTFV